MAGVFCELAMYKYHDKVTNKLELDDFNVFERRLHMTTLYVNSGVSRVPVFS